MSGRRADTIRVRLVQMEVLPGRPWDNTARMLREMEDARSSAVDLIAFPEMCIPGYLIGDEWERETFLRECEGCVEELRAASKGLIAVFGGVAMDWDRRNEDGRVRKYNALFVAEDGEFKPPRAGPYPFVIKTLMPNYREFDDSRHFFDLRKLAAEQGKRVEELTAPVDTRRLTLACALCEDAWDADYGTSPLATLAAARPDLFLNLSASPFTMNKNHKRNRLFSAHASRCARPMVYLNNVGIQNNGKTVFTFDGSSCVYDSRGGRVPCGQPFEDTRLTLDVPMADGAAFGATPEVKPDTVADLYAAIRYGTARFMDLCGVERVTIGISGGIDSSVVAAIYRQILPPERILLVNMPGRFNSRTTRQLAVSLAAGLDCFYAETPIDESVELTHRQIHGMTIRRAGSSGEMKLRLSELAMENIQARDRSSRILAAISAAFGGVFTCNANKSEATVGYTTLYGDLGGYLANIADLWKMEVYEMAQHLNRAVYGREVIPGGSIAIVPSAELSAAQNVDENRGDPLMYPYHDRLFESWVERWNRAAPEDVLRWYEDGSLESQIGYAGRVAELFKDTAAFVEDLERWWNQYQGMGLAKRIQAPPVLAVKRRAFGFDHRESQLGIRYTREYQRIKERLLTGARTAEASRSR